MRFRLTDDLARIIEESEELWTHLRGARIFLSGGTGFIGCWLLETLRHVNEVKGLNLSVMVLTRDAQRFRRKAPRLAEYRNFEFLSGDVCSFEFPSGSFSHLIHGATDASAELNQRAPLQMFDTVVVGTRRILDFADLKKIPKLLFMSSGAVYGQQPPDLLNVEETWRGAPDPLDGRSTYAEAKRAAELLCGIYSRRHGVEIVIARIFALLGPYLSLDIHFAAGNFIRDALRSRTIVVQGDGSPVRSYLYASDLVSHLLHLLVRGKSGDVYNIGSEHGISIRDLAFKVASLIGNGDVVVQGEPDEGWNAGRYVPSTTKLRLHLGLKETVSLDEAILRTAGWNRWRG